MQRQVGTTGQVTHPALTPMALGLLAVGTCLDVVAAGRPGGVTWLAFWLIAAGVAWGTWCASWALFDWALFARFGEQGPWGVDGFAVATIVGLFGLAALLRVGAPSHAPPDAAMALEVAGAALLGMRAWIGRELAAGLRDRS